MRLPRPKTLNLFLLPSAHRRDSPERLPGLEEEGIKAGVFRPITIWPYPYDALYQAAAQDSVKAIVTVEMNTGQMIDDVRIAVRGCKPVSFVGQAGGKVPTPQEVVAAARSALGR